MTDTLHKMLLRHAVEIAECPPEHAMAVAEAHAKEAMLAQALLDHETGPGFISVDDGLPEDARLCVVKYSFNGKHHGFKFDHYHEMANVPGRFTWATDLSTQPTRVTAWMPVPLAADA